jgi:hypothetical protein
MSGSVGFFAVCLMAVVCVAMAANPSFRTVAFEADHTWSPGAGNLWWDPVHLRARANYLDKQDQEAINSTVYCNKQLNQIESYEVIDSIAANFTFCAKRVYPGCTYDNFVAALGRTDPTLENIAFGVGVSMNANGTSELCTFPHTAQCLRYNMYGPGCDQADAWQWVVALSTDNVYYPQVCRYRVFVSHVLMVM